MADPYWKCPGCALRIHPDDAERNAGRCPACLNEEARTRIRRIHARYVEALETAGEARLAAAAAETIADRHHRTLEDADRYIGELEAAGDRLVEDSMHMRAECSDMHDAVAAWNFLRQPNRRDQRKRAESPPDAPETGHPSATITPDAGGAGSQGSASQQGQER